MAPSQFIGLASCILLVYAQDEVGPPPSADILPIPEIISAIATSGTSITVRWQEVNIAQTLYLAKANADEQVESSCSCTEPCNSCKLEGLRIGIGYSISLDICNEVRCISSGAYFYATTIPGVPDPPTNVTVKLEYPTQVRVLWDPPNVTNGEIANYTAIVYQPYFDKCTVRGNANTSCIMRDLFEGIDHSVNVYACNYPNEYGDGGGCSQLSNSVSFTTWTGFLDSTTMTQLIPQLGILPELWETTQAMITLPLSVLRLNVSGPLLKATLVVHSGYSSVESQSKVSLEIDFEDLQSLTEFGEEYESILVKPIGPPYRNNTNRTWEVVVINEGSAERPLIPDMSFVLGDGMGRPKTSHLYNGPLEPDTRYLVQLRIYLQDYYFTTKPLIFQTQKLSLTPVIIFGSFGAAGLLALLGFFIYLACRRANEYALLVRDAQNRALETYEWPVVENFTAFRPVKVNYVRRTAKYSYENRRIQVVAIDMFSDYVKHLLEPPNDNVNLQFQLLNILSKNEEQYWGLTTYFSEQFPKMTLHPDCPPYDQTVVVLDRSWAEYQIAPWTVLPQANLYADVYVDATYVNRCKYHRSDSFAIAPDLRTVPDFIAATTPMESTCPQFLTMIAQQCCPLIIHLDGIAETENFSQNQYWPKEFHGKTFSNGVRACNVFTAEVSNNTHWIDRMLEITPSDSGHSWTAEQMQISAWSSRRNPRPDILYDLVVTFLDKMAVHAVNEKVGPPIIHASSTDGRVGTFICAVSLLQQLQTNSNYIDVFGTVLSLRKQRSNLVNNKKQLEYLYRFMKYCISMAITVECEMPCLPEVEDTDW